MTPDLLSRLITASKADGNQYELCLSIAEVLQIMHQLDELEKLRQQVSVDEFCAKLRHLPAPPETDAKA